MASPWRALPIFLVYSLVAAEPVEACDCIFPGSRLLAPSDGATAVPLNTRIWVGSLVDPSATAEVKDLVEGDLVPVVTTTIDSTDIRQVRVLSPEQALLPRRQYGVFVDGAVVSTFTTGDSIDDAPPAPPELSVSATKGALPFTVSCGGWARDDSFVRFAVSHDGVLALIDLDNEGVFDAVSLSGNLAAATSEDHVFLGAGNCATGWSTAGPLAGGRFRAGTLDLAGNFSGFGDPVDVLLPPPGCSCSSSGSGEQHRGRWAFGFLFTLVVLPFCRRRNCDRLAGSTLAPNPTWAQSSG